MLFGVFMWGVVFGAGFTLGKALLNGIVIGVRDFAKERGWLK
jgi:hypothetical protein